MMLAIDGWATTLTWLRGWPVINMPSRQWTSCGNDRFERRRAGGQRWPRAAAA